jgi:hypothetical protein
MADLRADSTLEEMFVRTVAAGRQYEKLEWLT